jgi:hypothetical protein
MDYGQVWTIWTPWTMDFNGIKLWLVTLNDGP